MNGNQRQAATTQASTEPTYSSVPHSLPLSISLSHLYSLTLSLPLFCVFSAEDSASPVETSTQDRKDVDELLYWLLKADGVGGVKTLASAFDECVLLVSILLLHDVGVDGLKRSERRLCEPEC